MSPRDEPSAAPTRGVGAWADRVAPGRAALLVFVVLGVVYGLTATYRYPATIDVTNAVMPAYRLGVDGTLDVTPYASYIESRPVVREQFVEVEGRWYSGRNIGVILTAVPVYAVLRPSASPDALPPLWPGTVAAVLATSGALALLYLTFRTMASGRRALMATVVAALGTTAWSVASDLLWSHGPAMLWLAATVLALARRRDLLAGLAMGVAMTMRPELGLSAGVLALGLGVGSRSWRRLVVVLVGPAVATVALLAYNGAVLGAVSPIAGHRNTIMLAAAPSLAPARLLRDTIAVLVAPRNGLLLFSPFLLVLLPGLRAGWVAAADWVRAAAVAGVAHLALIVVIQGNGDGNFFFGYRFPLEMLTLAAPLLLATWLAHHARDRGWRAMFVAVAGGSIVVQAAGAILELRR